LSLSASLAETHGWAEKSALQKKYQIQSNFLKNISNFAFGGIYTVKGLVRDSLAITSKRNRRGVIMYGKGKSVFVVVMAAFVMMACGVAYGDGAIGPESSTMGPLASSSLFLPYVTYATGSCAEAVAIGDVNNDGRKDVVVATTYNDDPDNDHRINVFLQNSSGELEPPVKYVVTSAFYLYHPTSVDIGDLNNDGKNDVAVSGSNCVGVFYQNDIGTLDAMATYASAHSSGTNSYKVRIGDFNGDGLLDVVSIDWGTQSYDVDVFLQNLSGTLNAPVVYIVQHGGYDDLDVGDVNGDGLDDIIVMSGQGLGSTLGILVQNTQGTFDAPVYYDLTDDSLTNGVAVGDVNGDTRNDIAVTYPNYVGVFYQNDLGTLDPSIHYSVYGELRPVEIGDVNVDGRDDIVAAGDGALEVLLQSSTGTLLPYEQCPAPPQTFYKPHALDVGDINGDGANDVVLANCGAGLVVFYNSYQMELPTMIFRSIAADDGWVLELTETSNIGGLTDSEGIGPTALRLGDNYGILAGERQYKSILSFDTSSIPDEATIVSATLKLRRGVVIGTNPFMTHGPCLVDIVNGAFGGNPALQSRDFQAPASATGVAIMSNPLDDGRLSTGALTADGLSAINKTGLTQLRVYFSIDDDNDASDDIITFHSGDSLLPFNRPVLEVSYQ
jgi:hypothetical protein